jgi:catechol 2,3-dioxygenase-like lactoylglutathione lyase family enzyme
MFTDTKAFSSFAVDDAAAAKQFYGQTLGIQVEELAEGLMELRIAGGRTVLVYQKPDYTPATYTILNFPVDDIDTAVDELTRRGVSFERYEGFAQDGKGINRDDAGPPIAWFKDPSGNVLSVLEASPEG